MLKTITSPNNSGVKKLMQLQEKSRERKRTGLFVIEGKREIRLALSQGYSIAELWYCAELLSDNELLDHVDKKIHVKVSEEIYRKIAYRGGTEGLIAIAESKEHEISRLTLPENPLVLVAEAPEKPGNIGALLRTADAAGVDALLIANPRTDLYNPNIIRSSVGGVFTVPVGMAPSRAIIDFLKDRKINIYSAILQNAVPYQNEDYTRPTALVLGTEAHGLTEPWRKESTRNIIIPMQGKIDSMNVSVTAGILVFEAKRQRGFR